MPETPEKTASEPAVGPVIVRPRTVLWLRVLMLAALFATGALVGAVVMVARTPAPLAQGAAAKAPRRIKPSTRATQTPALAAPVVAPAKPTVDQVTIAGQVADEFGRAIAEATVYLGRELPHTIPNAAEKGVGELGVTQGPVPAIPSSAVVVPPSDASTVRTDQDGKFSIKSPQSGNLRVFVAQPGYEPNALALDGLRPGETRDQLYIVLRVPAEVAAVEPIVAADPNLARIAGVVIDILGRPVALAQVETDEGEASTQTDEHGAFELTGVVPGALRIRAEDETAGRAESQEVRARAGELLPGVRVHLPGRHVPSAAGSRAIQATSLPASATRAIPIASPLPNPPAKAAAAPLVAGVSLEQRVNSVVVSLIDQNSAAGQAGLLAGDTLLRVDDEPVLSAPQARGMLRDPSGVVARVHVMRGKRRVSLRWKRPGVRYDTPPDPLPELD